MLFVYNPATRTMSRTAHGDPSALRCAVVGLGLIGREHAAALAHARGAELVLCIDADPGAARRCPAGAAFASDLEALAAAAIDAVVVATPEPAHRAAVEAALAAGAAVLCEKPFASTLADADAMLSAAAESHRFLAVAHTLRFDPRYRSVAARVARGELGPMLALSARRCMTAPEGALYAGRTTLALCLGVHDLDVFEWLAGDVVRVYAEGGPATLADGTADAVVASLRFRSGAVATLELQWALPVAGGVVWDTHLVVTGTGGSAYLELRGGDGGDLAPELTYVADVAGVPYGVLRVQDEHFLRAVRDPSSWPGAPPADARRAVELALAIDRSVATGEPVEV
jgi:predicted dehydrogenase